MSEQREVDPKLDAFDQQFADRLIQTSLANSPADYRRLLYDCGFAAGQASIVRRPLLRVSLFAAAMVMLLAAVLLGRLSAPLQQTSSPQVAGAASNAPIVKSIEQRWLERRDNGHTYAALRLNGIAENRPILLADGVDVPRDRQTRAGDVAKFLD